MVIWIPKGEFPHWQEHFNAGWKNSNILAYRSEIRQKRVIHFENLYRYMYHYLTEEGWKDQWGHGGGRRIIPTGPF